MAAWMTIMPRAMVSGAWLPMDVSHRVASEKGGWSNPPPLEALLEALLGVHHTASPTKGGSQGPTLRPLRNEQ